jgi:hypothetical protein
MKQYWHPTEQSLHHARTLAQSATTVYDVGGRKGREFMPGAISVGWEGELKRDFEEDDFGFGDDFCYCRHTLEDLNDPTRLLKALATAKRGYIECPSALAELSYGTEVAMRRGYSHHRWVVNVVDGVLTFVPKFPIVDSIRFAHDAQSSVLLQNPDNWNVSVSWDEQHPLQWHVLKQGRDFSLLDLDQYQKLLLPHLAPVPAELSQITVMIARFPYGDIEHPDCGDWLMTTFHKMKSDPRIGRVRRFRKADTPIPMTRNEAVEVALQEKVDFLLMLDNDMSPDIHHSSSPYPDYWADFAKPFWDTSFEFALEQRAKGTPCIIGAPYCGPSPHQNVYVFQWDNWRNNYTPDAPDMKLDQFSRAEASKLTGIQEVAALPTGLILIDMRAFERATPPYFYYEYTDHKQLRKASTEDVAFTRDMSLYGVKQYCNWDAWCGHHKKEIVTKPVLLTTGQIGERMRETIRREFNIHRGEQLIDIKPHANGNGQYDPDQGKVSDWRPEWLSRV